MSGGHFDYQQYKITDMADSVERYVNGREFYDESYKEYYLNELKHNIERWDDEHDKEEYEYVKQYGKTKPNEYGFSEATIEEFKRGIEYLKKARIYADRIDLLLSGDDGEDDFHKLLKEDLEKI